MSAIITTIIPIQGFELVRNAIGAILKVELENQKTLSASSEELEVYSERITPISNSENLVVNVLMNNANYSEKTQKDSLGKTTYFIDIYANEKENEVDGGLNSASLLHRYIGMIRYILQYSEYKTLSLPYGIIGGTEFESFEIMESNTTQSADFITMARIRFSVRIQENQQLIQGVNLDENFSSVSLDNSELGFKYNFIN